MITHNWLLFLDNNAATCSNSTKATVEAVNQNLQKREYPFGMANIILRKSKKNNPFKNKEL
jgi:hypothetical protein